ncbi:DUF6169 family protein [Emticicia sp. CRIBPO]|uniref:DUF6169 family protein n=1 Tax=Emticicia sp. CRIBPO TaxID=2683258 RepID=UPI002106FA41|nr:DUF6169 family protein [Emticicia sp. CRIBPO]
MQKEFYKTYPVFITHESHNKHIYSFTTDSDIVYTVVFTRANYLFKEECTACHEVHEISFVPNGDKSRFDQSIRHTIIDLMQIFIDKHECPVLYVCDSLDLRAECRSRLFKKWFETSRLKSGFKYDFKNLVFDDFSMKVEIISRESDQNFNDYFQQLEVFG